MVSGSPSLTPGRGRSLSTRSETIASSRWIKTLSTAPAGVDAVAGMSIRFLTHGPANASLSSSSSSRKRGLWSARSESEARGSIVAATCVVAWASLWRVTVSFIARHRLRHKRPYDAKATVLSVGGCVARCSMLSGGVLGLVSWPQRALTFESPWAATADRRLSGDGARGAASGIGGVRSPVQG